MHLARYQILGSETLALQEINLYIWDAPNEIDYFIFYELHDSYDTLRLTA